VLGAEPAHPSSWVNFVQSITAVSALAAFHQPVPVHWPVDELYHGCNAVIPAAAKTR
jgi:hypothetical protein